mmetsp:Transcript_69176/g.196006  ORF Transcript_69176/g.196006 Transcript_69176/m.196006 type:complete len:244 (-) Transcript_69176:742-1473(-)
MPRGMAGGRLLDHLLGRRPLDAHVHRGMAPAPVPERALGHRHRQRAGDGRGVQDRDRHRGPAQRLADGRARPEVEVRAAGALDPVPPAPVRPCALVLHLILHVLRSGDELVLVVEGRLDLADGQDPEDALEGHDQRHDDDPAGGRHLSLPPDHVLHGQDPGHDPEGGVRHRLEAHVVLLQLLQHHAADQRNDQHEHHEHDHGAAGPRQGLEEHLERLEVAARLQDPEDARDPDDAQEGGGARR